MIEITEPLPNEALLPAANAQYFEDLGYAMPMRINGEIVGIRQFIFTVAIVVGLDESGYKYRFCYESGMEAVTALLAWVCDGGDEPKNYIKRKPELH